MPVVLDGGRIADPSDVEHLSRVLRSGFFIRIYDGIANEIITAVSINGNELSVMLFAQLRVNLFKELLSSLGAFSYVAGRIDLGHMFVSISCYALSV
jgi:hypothetical protein